MAFDFRYGRFDSPMRFQFRHASASRDRTENVIVRLTGSDGISGYGEGCPRAYVTGETTASAELFLQEYGPGFAARVDSLDDLILWIAEYSQVIDKNPAAFCALETAAIDVMARIREQSVEMFLGYSCHAEAAKYSAILGTSSPLKSRLMVLAYRAWGFDDFKFKLSGCLDSDQHRLSIPPADVPIRADANNLWQSAAEATRYMDQLRARVWAIEEPLEPGDYVGLAKLSNALDIPVVLDESLYTNQHLINAKEYLHSAICNIRVSKCGGILRSVELANQSIDAGYGIILGAQVGETSLLTRAALTVGYGLERMPLAREGAYGRILLQRDLCTMSLTFDLHASIKTEQITALPYTGNGLNVLDNNIHWYSNDS